ncbi:hypothetical protein ACOCJ7_10245 [Knoellia sp. CPCC 206453]|uniref:hypothetical protein n=1 Tax=Knoellia pratensis TaxID=3404796 RepID=UPI003607C0DE
MSSVASSMSMGQAWVPNDSATISAPAGGARAGNVTFQLYGTNPAQPDIPASCHETSALTVTNGGTISSPALP